MKKLNKNRLKTQFFQNIYILTQTVIVQLLEALIFQDHKNGIAIFLLVIFVQAQFGQ